MRSNVITIVMRYWVDYNGKFVAEYKTLRGCLNYIKREGLQNDFDNTLNIVDVKGNMYNTITGIKL